MAVLRAADPEERKLRRIRCSVIVEQRFALTAWIRERGEEREKRMYGKGEYVNVSFRQSRKGVSPSFAPVSMSVLPIYRRLPFNWEHKRK